MLEKKEDYLLLTFPQYPVYIARAVKIKGAYHEYDSSWSYDLDALDEIEKVFKGEIYFKTPRWKIKGEAPPKVSLGLINTYNVPLLANNMKPYRYQEVGYQFIRNRLSEFSFCMLSDDVGLGKTLVTVMSIAAMYREGIIKKVLILCKKSIKRQWSKEFDKFTTLSSEMHTIEYIKENATKKQREKIYAKFNEIPSGILITTYESCINDNGNLVGIGFDMAIVDEVHLIKTPKTVKNTNVKAVLSSIKYKVLLTGTPLTNKPLDLYGVVGLCSDSYFDMKISAFRKKYVTHFNTGRYVIEIGFRNIDDLRDKCQAIMLRRTEHEVDLDLPTIKTKEIICSIDKEQEHLNRIIMKMFKETLDKEDDEDLSNEDREKLEAKKKGLLGLRQVVANDPYIFKYGHGFLSKQLLDNDKFFNSYTQSNKTTKTIELVKSIVKKEEKVIIFSKYERTTRYLYDKLKGIAQCVRYTGKLSEDERDNAIDSFMYEEDVRVLLATNSGAEGINCQIANHVINYDLPDTVSLGTQRMGRIRRAGSEYSNGYVYNMITESSVDIKVKEKLERQQNLFSSVVELSEEQSKLIKEISN